MQNFDAVRTTLLEFPEPEHHAFVLRHWSGLVDREIADVLATSPGGVETLLYRARSKLAGERDLATTCQTVRIRLSMDQPMSAADDEHTQGCSGCRTARQRLAQVAGIAGVLALAPSVGVASAMAASVPGFAAGSATAGSGTGAAMVGAAAKAGLAVKAALAVVAIGASVAVVHAHGHEIVAGLTRVLERVVPQSGEQRPARRQTSNPVAPGASGTPGAHPVGGGVPTHRPPRVPPHSPTSGSNAHGPVTAGGGRPSRPSRPSRPPRVGVAPPGTGGPRKLGGGPTPPTNRTGQGTGASHVPSHQPSRQPSHP
jgi:Sigma-70, region 4